MDRRLERLDNPQLFLKGYFPHLFWRPFSVDQLDGIATIIHCAEQGADEIICASRGDWKTETLKHILILLIARCTLRFPVWIGATAESAASSFDHIKSEFESDLFSADFPEICDPIIALEGSPQRARRQTYRGQSTKMIWGAKDLIFPTVWDVPGQGIPSPYGGVKLTYRGLDAHIRGLNKYGDRPDAAFCDDLETRESADSDQQIETREKLLDNDVGGLGSGETIPRIVLGTVQNQKCLTFRKLTQWGGKRYQAVYKWPEDADSVALRDEYIEIRKLEKSEGSKTFDRSHEFYIANQDAIERGVELGNPTNKSRKKRADGTPMEVTAFQRVLNAASDKSWRYVNAELQNEPDEEETEQTIGLTAKTVMSRISGLVHNELPKAEGIKITLGLDVGKYYSHWAKVAWHGSAIGHVIDYGVMETPGMGSQVDPVAVMTALMPSFHNWRTEQLAENPPDFCLIDSGDYGEAVYAFVHEAGGSPFAASKGWDTGRFRMGVASPTRRLFDECFANYQPENKLWLYHAHTEHWKHWVQERFVTPTFDEQQQLNDGTLSLFSDPNDARRHFTFSKHMVSESRQDKFIEGKGIQRKWVVHSKNNHWLDAMALACAAAGVLGVRLIPRIETNQPEKRAGQIVKPSGKPFLSRPGGWVKGARGK